MRTTNPSRSEVAALADRQRGHVRRRQLLALGAGPEWIRSQTARGWLIRVHAGLYAVGHVPRDVLARACGAVLACGDDAALSHASAMALWGVGEWPRRFEITSPRRVRRPGIRAHQSRTLDAHDVRSHQAIRVTTPVRTVLDLQPRLSDAQLVRSVNALRVAGHLRSGAFAELCGESRRVERLLGSGGTGLVQRPTRSWLEDAFRRFTERHGLPMPAISAVLPHNGREVDALYPDERLIVEVDSWTFHSSRASFERDRLKDADALAHGYSTLRITDERLAAGRGGTREAARIAQILRLARSGEAASAGDPARPPPPALRAVGRAGGRTQ